MSFTSDVSSELVALLPKKSCCQKAFLCGLMFGCASESGNTLESSFIYEQSAAVASQMLARRFPDRSGEPTVEMSVRCGRKYYKVHTASRAMQAIFDEMDRESENFIENIIGIRCESCTGDFLRGVFLSCATVNNPRSGYHLEFSVPTETRAKKLKGLLSEVLDVPKEIKRAWGVGLYYKSGEKISDFLYMIGASKASFHLADISIERDIRNYENRATNCVTRNISRSVSATRKQLYAIEFLSSAGALDKLPSELQYTAELRTKYNSATLSELALLHEPSISKSGLNQRLAKIMAFAKEIESEQ